MRELSASLLQRFGEGGDQVGAGEATRVWSALHERLGPVIGETGFRALLGRSLHQASDRFEALGDSRIAEPPAPFLPDVEAAFRDAGDEALRLVVSLYLDNLDSLIGRDLILRLLEMDEGAPTDPHHAGAADE